MRVTITGIAGFAGSHLADHLLAERGEGGPEVHGIVNPGHATPNIAHLQDRIHLHPADMTNYASVRRALETARPERVYHLAARASVAQAWQDPERTLVDNIVMQLNLLRAVVGWGWRRGAGGRQRRQYIVPSEELPVSEATAPAPEPVCGEQDLGIISAPIPRGAAWCGCGPLKLGPRQSTGYVAPFTSRSLASRRGSEPVLQVGNLSARRDFTDVRGARLPAALELGQPGAVYNIGSARSRHSGYPRRALVNSDVPVRVEQDPARMRPSDTPEVVCDCRLFCAATGWQPRLALADSLRDVLEEWRAIVRRESARAP